ncbi:uncharacterized protein udd [Drosophila takahashii]|uniref:uncharacterized protein udd n=1 Tax=Drosophila takahashii TaxID=29030 RepID=UPI001CF8CDAC|nr:uncharacterized protein LOC108055050 [Drosophila takahashii]
MKTDPDQKPPLKTKERKINGDHFPARRIPPNVLKRTLEIATNFEDGYWTNKNTSCVPPTSYELYSGAKRSVTSEKLRLARSCLMQRDYKTLAKILASNHLGEGTLQKTAFTVFSEYSGLLQKHPKLNTKMAKSQEQPTRPKSPIVEEETMDYLLS